VEWRGVPPPGGRLIDGEPILPSCHMGNWRALRSQEDRIKFLSPVLSFLNQTEDSRDSESVVLVSLDVAIASSVVLIPQVGTEFATVEEAKDLRLERRLIRLCVFHQAVECRKAY